MLEQPTLSTTVSAPLELDVVTLQQILETTDRSLARAMRWRTPPNWSLEEWRRELGQVAFMAALEAIRDWHVHSGIVLGAFLYQRVMSKLRTRARNEWSFARAHQFGFDHCQDPLTGEPLSNSLEPDQEAAHRELTLLVSALPPPQRSLVLKLYWDGSSEAREAKLVGRTQSAINQRKEAILSQLRQHFAVRLPRRKLRQEQHG